MHDAFDRTIDIGIAAPHRPAPGWLMKLVEVSKKHWSLLAIVIVPSVVLAAWLFLVTADQYESDADFVVKSASQMNEGGSSGGLAQLFGLGGGVTASQSASFDVGDYMTSHDAVDTLARHIDLISMFRRPEADIVSRLWSDQPEAEDLLKFYRQHVDVTYNQDTAITSLKVRAFRPDDAHVIAETLLKLGEQRVNDVNQRAYHNGLAVASQQLHEAEAALAAAQGAMTSLRQKGGDIDPVHTSAAQITLVSTLRIELAQAKAEIAAMRGTVQPDSPQFVAQQSRVRALQSQVDSEAGRLTGNADALAPGLSSFEELRFRQDFVAKRYEAAAGAFETARAQLLKQQLFVIRVVEPNLPQKSLNPNRFMILATAFFGLLLAYGIGWLVVAGIKEHTG